MDGFVRLSIRNASITSFVSKGIHMVGYVLALHIHHHSGQESRSPDSNYCKKCGDTIIFKIVACRSLLLISKLCSLFSLTPPTSFLHEMGKF